MSVTLAYTGEKSEFMCLNLLETSQIITDGYCGLSDTWNAYFKLLCVSLIQFHE